MMRKKGFTLIELLVVIAIIAILAAMLFPVFARARESARKIQCLSNVKNIAIAVQMYLTDYERFPPSEHRAEVIDFLNAHGGKDCCCRGTSGNPYLRWPVILEEYTRNRDIWRCPSARFSDMMGICPGPDWFAAVVANESEINCYGLICHSVYPPGWGGAVTDSWAQKTCAYSGRAGNESGGPFEANIGWNGNLPDAKTTVISDPARYVAIGEVGVQQTFPNAVLLAYPDICRLGCSTCDWGPGANWTDCSWTTECGAGDRRLGLDAQYRKDFIGTRHLGGVNLGFADGHAAWWASEAILHQTEDARWMIPQAEKDSRVVALLGTLFCRFGDGFQ